MKGKGPIFQTYASRFVGRWSAIVLLIVSLAVVPTSVAQPTVKHEHIENYIEQLGAAQFRLREQAERELAEIGLLAFEDLYARRDDEDIEIRLRVRRLIERMRDQFLRDDIDPALQRYVDGYSSKSVEAREATISLVSRLLPQQGLSELARIARFEDNERLSKLAALAIVRESWPGAGLSPDALELTARRTSERVLEVIGYGDRVAVQWLRAFGTSLEDPRALQEPWKEFLADELALDATDDLVTSVEIIDGLRRLYADISEAGGQHDAARAIRREISAEGFADLVGARGWVDWLLRQRAWTAITDFAEVQPRSFERDAMLLYGLAEAFNQQGDVQKESESRQQIDELLANDAQRERYQVALYLETERGKAEWAEYEYRKLIDNPSEETFFRAIAYSRLAELLHNMKKDDRAAEVLEAFLKKMEESEQLRAVATEQLELELPSIRSRMNYFLACAAQSDGDLDQQRKFLELGLAGNATDADLLIAMYRYERPDEAWRLKTSRSIQTAVERLQREIRTHRQAAERAGDVAERLSRNRTLASSLNHFAWLVSNTEGDYQEALRLGLKSLELEAGDSGVMDTVARCYYSVGKLEEALKYQRWAVSRSPHETQIRNQLRFFEDEWDRRSNGSPESP